MTLAADSRYVTAHSVIVETDRGNVRALYRRQPQIQDNRRYTRQITVEWDRVDLIAANRTSLVNALQWWIVADINPQFHHPDDIAVGKMLRVPVL